jgi:hypothetical protein
MEVFFITGFLWMAFEDEGARSSPGDRKNASLPQRAGFGSGEDDWGAANEEGWRIVGLKTAKHGDYNGMKRGKKTNNRKPIGGFFET